MRNLVPTMLKVVSLPPKKKQINWKVILFVNITLAFYVLKMLKKWYND